MKDLQLHHFQQQQQQQGLNEAQLPVPPDSAEAAAGRSSIDAAAATAGAGPAAGLPCWKQEYLHASDLAAAFVAALGAARNPPTVYIVGSGRAYSQRDVWKACHKLFGGGPQVGTGWQELAGQLLAVHLAKRNHGLTLVCCGSNLVDYASTRAKHLNVTYVMLPSCWSMLCMLQANEELPSDEACQGITADTSKFTAHTGWR